VRPVNRGGRPAGYPISIRLDTEAHMQQDAGAIHWQWNAASVLTALGNNPSLWDVLIGMWRLAADEGTPQQLTNLRAAKGTMEDRLGKAYKQAAGPLATQLGKFCSYCEQCLPGQVDVEHCVPKSPFPTFQLCWNNFLLACGPCNGKSGKSQNPDRATVEGWGGLPPNPDDVNRYDEIRQRYVWPDLDVDAYRDMLPALHYLDTDGDWVPLADADSVYNGSVVEEMDLVNRKVTATIYHQGAWYNGVSVRCMLVGATNSARRTIRYYGFERPGTATASVADARMYNRTLAWFKVLTFLAPLRADLDNNFNTIWPLLVAAAPSIGFFSVWVRLLVLTGVGAEDEPGLITTVMDKFLADMNAPGGFPNTDTDNVP
jgi:hypothetical protein